MTLIPLAGRQVGRSVTRADGSYGVDAPGAGSYVLIASADGYRPQATTVVVGDEPVAFDILLGGTSGLTGVVRSADSGAPVADAAVIVTDVRGRPGQPNAAWPHCRPTHVRCRRWPPTTNSCVTSGRQPGVPPVEEPRHERHPSPRPDRTGC